MKDKKSDIEPIIKQITAVDHKYKERLVAIHATLKKIASNTENVTTADIAKDAAADLQAVVNSLFFGEKI